MRPARGEPAPSDRDHVTAADAPVALADVVAAIERLSRLAEGRGDEALATAGRDVRRLAERLRAQFVVELTGPMLPSRRRLALERVRERSEASRPIGELRGAG